MEAKPIASREDVVKEALTWLDTPYHTAGMVKGAGVDCATLLLCVYKACGFVPPEENLERYTQDWFCNTNVERYMFQTLRHAYKIVEAVSYANLNAEPGNIVMSKSVRSRLYNHGGIVILWPRVLHAVTPKVEVVDASTHWLWEHRTVLVFDPWEKLKRNSAA